MGHCIFVIHNITNYIGWNILEKKRRIYLRQYTIYLFHANNLIPPKIRNLTSKFWAYTIKTKLHAGRMQSTKETELSKLNHNIVILNTDQLTFPLHTSTGFNYDKTKMQIQSLQISSAVSYEPRKCQYIFNPEQILTNKVLSSHVPVNNVVPSHIKVQ